MKWLNLPIGLGVACVWAAAGCAEINPTPDYQRAAQRITEATGQDDVYQPGDGDRIAETVAELRVDGLTTDEAVRIALINNPTLQASFRKIGMAHADVVQSQLLSNPSVGISTQFPDGGGLVRVQGSFVQNLVDLWQLPLRKMVAERALSQTILEVAQAASNIAVDAKTAYYRAVAADELVKIAKQNRAAAERLLELTESLRDAGAISGVDVNLSRTELQDVELALRFARLAAFEERGDLARVLGLNVGPMGLVLTEAPPGPPDHAVRVEDILEAAAEHRMDIAAMEAALQSLSANMELERKSVFQVVQIGVAFEREPRAASSGGGVLAKTLGASLDAGRPALPRTFDNQSDDAIFTIGPTLRVELPIFDQNQAGIAKADLAYMQAVKEAEALLLEITQDARLAHERARVAWENSGFYRTELLPLRNRNLELAREAYRSGKISLIEVLAAQRTLQEAKAGQMRALRDSALAWAEIERVTASPMSRLLDEAKNDASGEQSSNEEEDSE